MLDFSIYLFYRAGMAIASVLPLRVLFALGSFLGLGAWLLLPQYRRLSRRNLKIAFGNEKSPRELRRIGRRNFQWQSANLICGLKMVSLPREKLLHHVPPENLDAVHHELRGGRPVVLILSHIGSWELAAQLVPLYLPDARIGSPYQSLRNRYIDRDIGRRRARTGSELFDRSEGFHKPIELLRSGGLLGIFSDQHAGDHGLWTPFFGRLASTSALPGLLAKRTGAAVMAAAVHTEGPARWRMVFTSRLDAAGDSVDSITLKQNIAIEQQIRRAPEDWLWVHNRWKTPRPNFLLTPYKRGIYVPPEMPATDLKPFRILIRGSNWLGDSIISMRAVRAIKAGRPDAHITIAAPAIVAAVWKLLPEVDEVIALTSRSIFTAVKAIRRQQPFDVAILFPGSLRSALEVWLAGVPRRVGYAGHHRRWLLNQLIPDRSTGGPIEHEVHHYLEIARSVGAPTSPVETLVTATPPLRDSTPIKIALCPGAEYGPAKRWLPERFAEVAAEVAAQQSVEWILFGTSGDQKTGEVIAAALGSLCTNRIGLTTLEELIAELRQCALLLTNDTGTMHLATLLGVPVVAIFGSTEPRLTGPLGPDHRVLRHHVECSPCFLRECPIDFRCMKAVSAEEVSSAVLGLLNN
ncbi:MAG: lipopolysaccharide heptosyltransferase II [Verrucomicrobiota bacterium]